MDITCNNCGILFSVPQIWYENRRERHDTFYCPNGHHLHFPSKSDLEKKDEEIRALKKTVQWNENARKSAQEDANRQFRRVAVYKGKFKHLRNIITGEAQ